MPGGGEGSTRAGASERRRSPLPLLPARWRGVRPPRLWQEVLFIGIGYALYTLIRNHGVQRHPAAAFDRAERVLRLERTLHINLELALNKAVASVSWLVPCANYYYATLHFAVTIGVLLWLYFRHPLNYRSVRTALYVTNYAALLGFWLFPLAPPRMLTWHGYIDTVVQFHTWGSYGSGSVDAASNQFAAMPSLHIGWSLWCGITIVMLSSRTWVKVLGALYPVLTLLVIVSTANHFVLDAIGGATALAIGYTVQWLLTGRRAYAPPSTVPTTSAVRVTVASA